MHGREPPLLPPKAKEAQMIRSARRLAAVIVLIAALPATAKADKDIVAAQARADGATVDAELRQRNNGAVYVHVRVGDTLGEGLCAHGTIRWHHVNGNAYDDYGMVHCGFGTTREFDVPDRNWRAYEAVTVGAFVDGGSPVYITIHRWGDWNEMKFEADHIMRLNYREFMRYKRKAVQWPMNWSDDGCTKMPDYGRRWFNDACEQHDFGYRNYGKYLNFGRNERAREAIDGQMYREMRRICEDRFTTLSPRHGLCIDTAYAAWRTVRGHAKSHFYG
jgi:hypothetical protein